MFSLTTSKNLSSLLVNEKKFLFTHDKYLV